MHAAPGDLERGLRNLIDNAVRYARHRVDITVRTGRQPPDRQLRAVVVEVRDDGPGVPEHERERVFERFARLDEARDRGSGNAGLGLSIARDVVERHHGTLHAIRCAAGARFVLRLPGTLSEETGR